jgi:hypothetical protein
LVQSCVGHVFEIGNPFSSGWTLSQLLPGLRSGTSKVQAEHVMVGIDLFSCNGGANETCGSGDESMHMNLHKFFPAIIDEPLPPQLKRKHSPQ